MIQGDWKTYTNEEMIEVLDADEFEREVARRMKKLIEAVKLLVEENNSLDRLTQKIYELTDIKG